MDRQLQEDGISLLGRDGTIFPDVWWQKTGAFRPKLRPPRPPVFRLTPFPLQLNSAALSLPFADTKSLCRVVLGNCRKKGVPIPVSVSIRGWGQLLTCNPLSGEPQGYTRPDQLPPQMYNPDIQEEPPHDVATPISFLFQLLHLPNIFGGYRT